ncbi:hypothetical protein CY34DRAFT_503926 [Suillus luteus UH-Slu-Lm8-n1]|uniref:Unplaced genomic scaffold CY34scaffold_381, whole genome shotgun sequence n=1 Tax=Suillus luteus UH-Slu-Lm8-n1 TaxID=930992 RepID=A0A0D0AET8_9AGAM|nr:hypothetical protein CY34DRAFT_503926 [Suillus luteus UH-Slu-Lm8-n1]
MITWAAVTMCMSAVPTYHAVLILRFWLGFMEATFMPGAVFLLSRLYRYKRNELGLRMAFLYCGGSAIALIIFIGTSGFISSSFFWPSSWGPSCANSYLICTLASGVCIAMLWASGGALSGVMRLLKLRLLKLRLQERGLGISGGLKYIL